MPHRSPVLTESIPEVHLTSCRPLEAMNAGASEVNGRRGQQAAGDSTVQSYAMSDGGIHVYAHKMGDITIHTVDTGSEEVRGNASLDLNHWTLFITSQSLSIFNRASLTFPHVCPKGDSEKTAFFHYWRGLNTEDWKLGFLSVLRSIPHLILRWCCSDFSAAMLIYHSPTSCLHL